MRKLLLAMLFVVSPAFAATYEDGIRDSISVVQMVRAQIGNHVALDMVQVELEAKLVPATPPAPAFKVGEKNPDFKMTEADWMQTNAFLAKASPQMASVIAFNKRWMPQSMREYGLVEFHPTLMASPQHIMHVMCADMAAKAGVDPAAIKKVRQ